MAYVYTHTRLDNNEVFYVGIGSDKNGKHERAFSKWSRNRDWHLVLETTTHRVKIIFDNISWEEANKLEIELIEKYGREDRGKGWLVNNTDGGGGMVGYQHLEETKKRIAKSSAERWKINHDTHVLSICKPLLCYNKQGNFLKEFVSAKQAGEELSLFRNSVTQCAKGKLRFVKGYHFRYKTDAPIEEIVEIRPMDRKNISEVLRKKQSVKTEVFKNQVSLGIFESIPDASSKLNLPKWLLYQLRNSPNERRNKKFSEYTVVQVEENPSRSHHKMWQKTPRKIKELSPLKQKKAVIKIDKNTGELLKVYSSITEAAKDNSCDISQLSDAARGKGRVKTAGGFKWRFLKEIQLEQSA